MHPRYPVLHLIDQVRGANYCPFVDDPDADALERSAEMLVDAYRGDVTWLTGDISGAALPAIRDALERERTRVTIRAFATLPKLSARPTTPAA